MRTLAIFLAIITILACSALHAADTPRQPDIACDFNGPIRSPWLRLVGDAKVEGGVLKTAAQANWQRSGLEVGPIPIAGVTWHIEYDFRAVAFGDQCQEFVSQSPSTHWYMCYLQPQGHANLHTKAADGWQLRKTAGEWLKVDTWYHVTVRLTAKSIQLSIEENDGKGIWDTGEVAMDDLGTETTFALVDEAAKEGGKTEWDNLTVSTDDLGVSRKLKQIADRLEKQRKEQERREAAARKLRAKGIALIPMPQEVELGEGDGYKIGDGITVLGRPQGNASAVEGVLEERLGLKGLGFSSVGEVRLNPMSRDNPAAKHGKQAYTLRIDKHGVAIEALDPQGFYYAAQTLCQLASPTGQAGRGRFRLPAINIADWPAIENRLVMVAVSQGAFQVIDVDYWKRMIRELAAVKITHIMPYFEGGTMYYEKYPFLGLKGRDGFTIAKGKELSEYAKQHFVEMVPQQESLGHSGNLLVHDELKDIRESGDVFCSSNPKTFEFLGDLYDELCQAFPYATWIHVGGDEFAGGFAQCPLCKKRAAEIGKPGLYAEHMMKLREMLKARHRGMMIWWHEEGYTDQAADKLAKDIAVFDWHYGNQASYPTLAKLQGEGFKQTWATPAVTRYYDAGNDWDNTFGNISGFMRAGAEANVPGECTCTWVHGVWGGRNLFELNLYGVVYSGACAWNPYASDYAGFRADFGREWFGVRTAGVGEIRSSGVQETATAAYPAALAGGAPPLQGGERANGTTTAADPIGQLVCDAIHAPYGAAREQSFWGRNAAAEEMLAAPLASTAEEIKKSPEIVDQAHQLLALCQRAQDALAALRKSATRNQVSLDFYGHDVHIHETLARRIITVKGLMDAWEQAKALKGKQREDLLTAQIGKLRSLVEDYRQIEAMFDRSVKEAGGGKCGSGGWYPFVASGGIIFRAADGRAAAEKEIEYINRSATLDSLPEQAFGG
jgi:hypothetical protein